MVEIPDPYGFVVRLALVTGLRWGEFIRAQSTNCAGPLRRGRPRARALRGALRAAGLVPLYLAVLGCACARAQRRSDALRILVELERRHEKSLASTFDLANLCTSLGDTVKAIVWLEEGMASRDPWLVEIDAWPWFDALRGDPRFREVRRRVGLPTDQAEPNS